MSMTARASHFLDKSRRFFDRFFTELSALCRILTYFIFPKGMYVYRNISTLFSLIPKGLYVIPPIFTYNPFGIKEKSAVVSL